MADQIPGVPDGWELVHANRFAEAGEFILTEEGNPYMTSTGSGRPCPIIRKIEKPERYRPFANAAEYMPHRDRWLTRKDKSDLTHVDGACRVVAYDDQGLWFTTGNYHTWEAAFDSGRCFDDDGTPFGVKIDE
jgi:hypothetical protein